MATIGGEDGAEAVADEGIDFALPRSFAAVLGLDMAIVVAVAGDEALEVGGFVEDGGEEVVVTVGGAICGGAVGSVGEGLAVFGVVPGGGIDVPTEAVGVGVGVEDEGAGVGAACGVEACDSGFGELACGEIYDLDVEVKWSCPLEEF